MQERICRLDGGVAAFDYTSLPKQPAIANGNLFAGLLDAQMQDQNAFDSVVDPILLRRSRYMHGESPVRFGIHQATLKDYDPEGKVASHVSQLTPAKARVIYQRIWDRSGAAALPAELQAAHFETYIRRPQTARTALEK